MDLIEFVRGPGGPRKKAWDSSPHKPVPSNLRGIKPISYEPWAIDAKRYYDQNKDMSKFALYDDRSVLATSKGYKSTITKTGWNPTQEWDSSPYREAPPGLRGIKPGVTKEPWMHDKMLYNKDSLFKEDGPSSSGDHHRAAGATAGSWDGRFLRIGEHQPAWESWGASLSA